VKGEVIVIPIINGERGHTKGGGDNHGENNENKKNHAERWRRVLLEMKMTAGDPELARWSEVEREVSIDESNRYV
jgi:hypothetical protein